MEPGASALPLLPCVYVYVYLMGAGLYIRGLGTGLHSS